MKTRALVLLAVAVVVASGGLLWLLIAFPGLAAPVESVAVVLGTAFTAFAAYSALRAAQTSRAATADTLRRERGALFAERTRLESQSNSLESWRNVTMNSGDFAGAGRLTSELLAARSRLDEIDARLAELAVELGE